ncbi:metal-dependent hydrolase [Elizabethkingia anophelis]|uniref:M48 family metallopeptidase n=1 Tax=Elizabethkingia anophelis TaxID=1117645 RepID=UPI0023E9D9CE|nr:SprT family zinc-dependent metalloprotease [Elizabethkingia anophelis]MDV3950377.1 metal-dependent hydrolase [Elizabethkingia anophelis]GJN61386.1 metal-dependent hydrolase [Elizabethkingia anophelis]HDP3253039.1 M48 family metallopeptidase [Elizabethkingia anophelis]
MSEVFKFNDIEVELSFKDIKNVHLRVHPPLGRVTLSAPENMDKEHLRVYVSTKLGWIRREKKKITSQKREPEYLYITNESHYFFGKRYLLKITESDKQSKVVLHHSKIEMIVPDGIDKDYIKNKLYQWYRKQLRQFLFEKIEFYKDKMNVSPESFGIRKVKTKWGSCNDSAKTLWFNIELAKKPKDCIEYIVVHELVHLKERRHNKNFILLMNKYYPNWQLRKKELNELPI